MQAVNMVAGSGSRMYPLTENIPKALLPVVNLPVIRLLEKAVFEFESFVLRCCCANAWLIRSLEKAGFEGETFVVRCCCVHSWL